MTATTRRCTLVLFCLIALPPIADAADKDVSVPGEKEPVLRLESGGPTAHVTSLAFGPDGDTLYAAGFDKVVRVWKRDETGAFKLQPTAYRVPIGPGLSGAINAIAISPDGKFLAAGGLGAIRHEAGFRQPGLWLPFAGSYSDEELLDLGTVYVFDTTLGTVRRFRSHPGPVLALAFVPGEKKPQLVSVAREWDDGDGKTGGWRGGVRTWTLDGEAKPKALSRLPDPGSRAGLAVWSDDGLHVAFALGDGKLRLWDGASDKPTAVADGTANYALTLLRGPARLLTGSYEKPNGQLSSWDVSGGKNDRAVSAAFPPEERDGTRYTVFAMALTTFAGPGGLKAAVAVFAHRDANQQLRIVDLKTMDTSRKIPLWVGQESQPVLATSPDGKFLAVGGSPRHEILVFDTTRLLKEDEPQPQRLRGEGAMTRQAAFLTRGESRGLMLSPEAKATWGAPPRKPRTGDVIFDITGRALSDNLADWVLSAPDAREWIAQVVVSREGTEEVDGVAVNKGKERVTTLRLKPKEEVTDCAVLPPRAPLGVPLLAVAYLTRFREPMLALYDGSTGQQVRQLTGHTGTVRSVAFSADGQLLVTAGDDQTVCIWGLTDLVKHVGRAGFLNGVALVERGGRLTVREVDPDGPARRLVAGDAIEGIVEGEKVRKTAEVTEFYETLLRLKPGSDATLKVRGKDDVVVRLRQAIDQRKPLFSLFVTQGGKVTERDWVGWASFGPYEASSDRAERLIGWHLGTGNPERPTSFVLAKKYHEELYREGLLDRLMRWPDGQGKIPPPPPLRPHMTLWTDDGSEGGRNRSTDEKGASLIRRRSATLRVALDGCPDERVKALSWQSGDAVGELKRTGPSEWEADLTPVLAKAGWKRDPLAVGVRLTTKEETPQEFANELGFRYLPPPPDVTLTTPRAESSGPGVIALDAADATLPLKARVAPSGVAEEKVVTRLIHRHDGKEVVSKEFDPGKPVEGEIGLRAGVNQVEIVARNQDASAATSESETRRLVLEVRFKPSSPLRIVLNSVKPLVGDRQEAIAVERDRPVVVTVPRVRVSGEIRASDPLTRAEWSVKGAAAKTIPGFEAKGKGFAFRDLELNLDPGKTEYSFTTATSAEEKDEYLLTIDYRPAPPSVVLSAPSVIYEGIHKGDLSITGKLQEALDARPQTLKAILLVEGREIPDHAPELNANARTLTARVPVVAGQTHRIAVRLSNDWGNGPLSDAVTVRFSRPARAEFASPPAVKEPFADLKATVHSALPLRSVRAEVSSKDGELRLLTAELKKTADETWAIALPGVALREGENVVRLWADNGEPSPSEATAQVTVNYQRPVTPPQVEILEPRQGGIVQQRTARIAFRIRSEKPLRRITVERGREVLATVKPSEKPRGTIFEQEAAVEIKLLANLNELEVVAASEDGEMRTPVKITRIPASVWLDIEALEVKGTRLEPVRKPGGEIVFAESSQPMVRLIGQVTWDDAQDAQLGRDDLNLRVFVNGFQHPPAPLHRVAGRPVMEFRAELVLNRKDDNRIRVELPENVRLAADSPPPIFVEKCTAPVTKQYMHLLIIAAGRRDEETLSVSVLKALGVKGTGRDLKTDLFEKVEYWGALTGADVTEDHIITALRDIRREMRKRAEAGNANDVIMVYYDGRESFGPSGHTIEGMPGKPVACARLETHLQDQLGACVLLFDVERVVRAGPRDVDAVSEWGKKGDTFAILRAAWEGEATTRPETAPLLSAWAQALEKPEVKRLGEATILLEKIFASFQGLRYDPFIPKSLRDLPVNNRGG